MSSDPQNADKALLDRLESRLGGDQYAAPNSDPLSELARLIGDASSEQHALPQAPQSFPQAQPDQDAYGQPPQSAPSPAGAPASNLESDIAAQLALSLQNMDFDSAAPGFSQPPQRQGFAPDGQQPASVNPELADLYGHQQPLNLRQPGAGQPYGDNAGFQEQPQDAGNAVHFDAAAPNFQASANAETGFDLSAARLQSDYAEHGFAPDASGQGYEDNGYGEQAYVQGADDIFADYDAEPETGKSRRGILVAGTVLAFVVVGGVAVFGYRAIVGGGELVPTIRAVDGDPRTLPQAEQPANDQNKLVYERINGTGVDGQAQLVPREENPAVAPADRQIRVVTGGQSTEQDSDATRTVRTFSISPDGQIVQNPAPEPIPAPETVVAVAPPVQLPAQVQPAAVPQARVQAQPQPSAVATQVAVQPPRVQPAPVVVPPAGPSNLNQEPGVALPVVALPPPPVIVQPQPTVQPPAIAPVVNPLAQQQQTRRFSRNSSNDDPLAETLGQGAQAAVPRVAAAPQPQTITLPSAQAPQGVPQAVAPQAAAPQLVQPQQQGVSLPFGAAGNQQAAAGGSVVQVASSRSEGDARTAISRARQRFGGIIGNYQSSVARSDLGSRGIYYRASFGPMSRSEATDVCNRLKARGGDCFVRANGG